MILYISNLTKHVSISNKMLKLLSIDNTTNIISLEDIHSIVLESNQLTITAATLSTISEHNIALIVSNNNHMPVSQIIPYSSNSLSAKHTLTQTTLPKSTKEKIWSTIISSKITNQYETLQKVGINSMAILRLITSSIDNREALAARYYFSEMFGSDFVRNNDSILINSFLNYGYAILRSKLARSICGCGLSPTFGLFHHNQYNPFALADDLMEPFRPFVDYMVKSEFNNVNEFTH